MNTTRISVKTAAFRLHQADEKRGAIITAYIGGRTREEVLGELKSALKTEAQRCRISGIKSADSEAWNRLRNLDRAVRKRYYDTAKKRERTTKSNASKAHKVDATRNGNETLTVSDYARSAILSLVSKCGGLSGAIVALDRSILELASATCTNTKARKALFTALPDEVGQYYFARIASRK